MEKEKIRVYTYTRVSTSMQTEGYSLDAQKSALKSYADLYGYEIVGEYEDAGKSGKSVLGRDAFNQMLSDIQSGKDGVSFVLVFKLSRFGRNAADVLNSLQFMQDFGVNLICVNDSIDSSKDSGKLIITVLSAVAEIERENISEQTMEGRRQKAREGKWNGGPPPYGFKIHDGKLEIVEEEAEVVREIFDLYVNSERGANGIAKYLQDHGVKKIKHRKNESDYFSPHYIRVILDNPVYCGRIAYGRRKREKVVGTRNGYHIVNQDRYLITEDAQDPVVSEELWEAAQEKRKSQAKRYEHVNNPKNEKVHLLSGIVRCPLCGEGMLANKSIKYKKDGTKYKDYYYYGCKNHSRQHGNICSFKKQIKEELLDDAIEEIIVKLVSNPKFAELMREKIDSKIDTAELDKEVENCRLELRKAYAVKGKLVEEMDGLDPEAKHYTRRKTDLEDSLYKIYDKLDDLESRLGVAQEKKQNIEKEKTSADNIYKFLIEFNKLYAKLDDIERRGIVSRLISEIQIYEERQPNGAWIKSVTFKLPIIEEDIDMSLNDDTGVETVVLLRRADT